MQLSVVPHQIPVLTVPGAFLEIVVLDPTTGQSDGSTAVFQVSQAHPADASGAYVEGVYLGASSVQRGQQIQALMQQNAVLHFCAGQCANVAGSRPVIHVRTVRSRQPQDLNEPWVVPNLALQAIRASMGAGSGSAAKAPPPPPAAPKDAPKATSPASKKEKLEKKRKKKLKKLLKRAKEGGGKVQGVLLKKVKKNLAAEPDSTSTSSSSDFHEAPSRTDRKTQGNKIARLAREAPGSLLESGLAEVSKFLQARGGVDSATASSLAPLMMTYFRSVWQGGNPADKIGARNNAELELLAGVIDRLLEGDLAGVGDTLMQRFRAVHMAASHGCRVASELELGTRTDASLVSEEMREEALRSHSRHARVEESIRRARGTPPSKGAR